MSPLQRLSVLAIAILAAIMCLGMANRDNTDRDRKQSLYTCTVWNDRSWAGCP